ncbi:4032_t:CDS:2, partial [Dentiscutata erythropus]
MNGDIKSEAENEPESDVKSIAENDKDVMSNGKPLIENIDRLKEHLKVLSINSFDHSQFNENYIIGSGGSATVISASLGEQKYALKRMNNNICLNDITFNKLVRENILTELRRLSTDESTKYITNNIIDFTSDNHNKTSQQAISSEQTKTTKPQDNDVFDSQGLNGLNDHEKTTLQAISSEQTKTIKPHDNDVFDIQGLNDHVKTSVQVISSEQTKTIKPQDNDVFDSQSLNDHDKQAISSEQTKTIKPQDNDVLDIQGLNDHDKTSLQAISSEQTKTIKPHDNGVFDSQGPNDPDKTSLQAISSEQTKTIKPQENYVFDSQGLNYNQLLDLRLSDSDNKKIINEIKSNSIKIFNYSEFSNREMIGAGSSAKVFSAVFQGKMRALKYLNKICLDNYKGIKAMIREFKILRKTNHSNIIEFYGIFRDPKTCEFVMVLQLAENGNLRTYLKGKQLDGIFKISYYDAGDREKIIPNTPKNYTDLFTKCWSFKPDQRPVISKVLEALDFIEISKSTIGSDLISNYIGDSRHNKVSVENKDSYLSSYQSSETLITSYNGTVYPPKGHLFDDLWRIFFDSTSRGIEFSQISKMLADYIVKCNQTEKTVFTDLNQRQTLDSNLQCLFGFSYFMGIGTEPYNNSAFNMFEKYGYGTAKDPKQALTWYQKSKKECSRS